MISIKSIPILMLALLVVLGKAWAATPEQGLVSAKWP
jgi:hypothetical protein